VIAARVIASVIAARVIASVIAASVIINCILNHLSRTYWSWSCCHQQLTLSVMTYWSWSCRMTNWGAFVPGGHEHVGEAADGAVEPADSHGHLTRAKLQPARLQSLPSQLGCSIPYLARLQSLPALARRLMALSNLPNSTRCVSLHPG
jgi:hypothetical protein